MITSDSLKAGDKFEMTVPFHRFSINGGTLNGNRIDLTIWQGGCEVHTEKYSDWESERFFTAHGEGKVIYEVLSIAKMPGRYLDRVVYKRSTIDPDGYTANPGEVKILTIRKFLGHVNSGNPFPVEYELEAA